MIRKNASSKSSKNRDEKFFFSFFIFQKDLFHAKLESLETSPRDRKLSAISNASMKSKWLKAFKSLKSSGPSNGSVKETEK